jgi:hypothetical protein
MAIKKKRESRNPQKNLIEKSQWKIPLWINQNRCNWRISTWILKETWHTDVK